MTDPKYKAFTALDPFFDIVQRGLAGRVAGAHYFETIADNAVFEFRYIFPGWPQRLEGREALMALYAGYGNNIALHGADALIVHRSQDTRVVILEFEVHGKIIRTGASYDNRFISIVRRLTFLTMDAPAKATIILAWASWTKREFPLACRHPRNAAQRRWVARPKAI
jgi:ketosteroid isomerase-like protein